MTIIPDGFSWDFAAKGQGKITWSEITYIEVFKKDLITTDIVCMNLRFQSDLWLSLNEEDVEGFIDLLKAMSAEWGLGDQWYWDVVVPAFETRKTTISRSEDGTMKLLKEW